MNLDTYVEIRSASTAIDILLLYVTPSDCAICTDGFSRGLGYTCLKCNMERRYVAIAIAVIIPVGILALVTHGMKMLRSGNGQERSFSRRSLARKRSRFMMARTFQALKIIIVSWQIITQVGTTNIFCLLDLNKIKLQLHLLLAPARGIDHQ